MSDGERELQVGRDYPMWPRLKWGHASRLHSKLLFDYQMWRASLTSETHAEFSSDRLSATLYASITNAPPLYEWSLSFGDIIHNYRSSLDALAWAMAHLDGSKPRPQDEPYIYFPLKKSRTEFEKEAKKRLASVPDFVLNRMQSVQPYHGGPHELAIGKVLHALDIQDKHRFAVEIRAVAADKTHYSVLCHPEDEADLSTMNFEDEWVASDRQIRDGDQVVVLRFTHPVREVEIPELPLKFLVELGAKHYDLFDLLRLIDDQVRLTFHFIETGRLPEPSG